MKKTLFYAVMIAAICFASCNNDDIFIETNEVTTDPIALLEEVYSADQEVEMLRPFARALYNAMSESPILREILKTKALEQFNKEYDVLYQFIKDEPVENGLTVRQLLLTHFENEEMLADIERRRPTLTIFVPQLPEESFSAEIWNTAEEIPAVALHVTKHIHTPIFGDFGEYGDEFVVESGLVPAFPVVVLKNNARVVVAEGSRTRFAALDNPNCDFVFEFTHEYFDNSEKEVQVTTRQTVYTIDPKVKEAFEIYQDVDGWQRDYIYYGITPSSPNGPLSRSFQEHITSFRFSSKVEPKLMLEHLTKHGSGPTLITFGVGSNFHPWTTGHFAFLINTQIGATSQPLSERSAVFLAYPEDLFEVTYTVTRGPMGSFFYVAQVTGFKTMKLTTPLMTWNLAQYEPTMKIVIFKMNDQQTITSLTSYETEFAGNIGLDLAFGTDSKSGLKFGTSAKEKKTVTVQTVTSLTNQNLGDVLVDFGDKVVVSYQPQRSLLFGIGFIKENWQLRKYENNMYSITVEPVRVE
ncbi:MAG: hypothetical protein LBI15_09120 [Dysgonamonadaceae bacterium]|jgi:hypothetical protein|nr:hypothetical protein [Dysgonamonadaceae bacterium]